MSGTDQSPILARQASRLFGPWKSVAGIVLAVSGGPDSLALMWLAARWRKSLKRGPALHVVTVDHQLRPESAGEARKVKSLACSLGLSHRTLRWRGEKPRTGIPQAARAARYRLLEQAARRAGASHIMTAHTRDDQAETVLMRLTRGSGLTGLAAMAVETSRDGAVLARPLLDVSKARLIATLDTAGIGFATDPTNADPRFTRPRLRSLMPLLAVEGCDSHNLARLAGRMARAESALELLTDGAERYLALHDRVDSSPGYDARAFAALGLEIRIRLLLRMMARFGHEGPAELGKVEALAAALELAFRTAGRKREKVLLKQTLAGAAVTLTSERLSIAPAPPRRRARGDLPTRA
jgi:tRNA(Ile)-lysidine synthase